MLADTSVTSSTTLPSSSTKHSYHSEVVIDIMLTSTQILSYEELRITLEVPIIVGIVVVLANIEILAIQ
jgi:hypothetical protein